METKKTIIIPKKGERDKSNLSESSFVTSAKINFDPEEIKTFPDVYKRYQFIEKFAEGGQGELKTADDRLLKRRVAVKSLPREHMKKLNIVSNFVSEAKITAQLDHPSIIPLYDLNSDVENCVHMAMKLIRGKTLDEIITDLIIEYKKKGKLAVESESDSLKARLEDFVKVCDAVNYAHSKNVVHRDLKPDNIMIGQYHEVYVMDWGLAAVLSSDGKVLPDKNGLCGTPGYMAPEVIYDQIYSPLSDQYALGMTLFEIVALKKAVTGKTVEEIMGKICSGNFESFEHFLSGYIIPTDLKAIVKKNLSVKPENRYESVAALSDDLRRFLRDEETLARPDNFTRFFLRKLYRHRNLTAFIITLILLIFAGITIFSLVEQKKTVIESKKRSLSLAGLQSAVSNQAAAIDRHLLQVSTTLERFSDKLEFLLQSDESREMANICEYRTFKDNAATPPSGIIMSKYYKQNISIDAANYKLAPGIALETVRQQLTAINPIVKDLLRYMTAGENEYRQLKYDELKEIATTKGLPISWIYVGFDTGLLVNYPGNGILQEDYDPRKRPWYLTALKNDAVAWSPPYVDAFGFGVVMSASKKLREENGHLIGVASLDMTFDHIAKLMKTQIEGKEDFVIQSYLLNAEGDVFLTTKLKAEQLRKAQDDFSPIKFDKFPYPQVLNRLKKSVAGQFEIKDKSRELMICCAPIHTMGWYYVEEIDLKKFLSVMKHDKKQF